MKSGSRGVISGINITPLTDIFLVLLIIMMLLPIIEMKELQLNVRPTADAPSDPKNPPKTFTMSVLTDKFTVQKQDVAGDTLADELKTASAEHPDGLIIEVSPESRHEQLAQALSAAKLAGITKVAVKKIPGANADAKSSAKDSAPQPPTAPKPPAKGK